MKQFLCFLMTTFAMLSAAELQLDLSQPVNIVQPSNPAIWEKTAIVELADYLERTTKLRPVVHSEPCIVAGQTIYVGATRHYAETFPKKPLNQLPVDTICIRPGNGVLHLAGEGTRGTLYAVYEFLERYLGIRWYTPEFEKVPSMQSSVLSISEYVYSPIMEYREPCHIGLNGLDVHYYSKKQIRRFATRMRSNGMMVPDDEAWGLQCKTLPHVWPVFRELVPPEKYFDEHPEWYALVDGKRDKSGQLCLTNSGALNALQENFLRQVEEHPDATHLTITQNDTGREDWCHCPDCLKALEEEEAPSGLLLRAVNQVADALAAKYPGKLVNTLAYGYNFNFPKVTRPRANVSIQISCPMETLRFDSTYSVAALDDAMVKETKNFYDTLQQWSAVTTKLYAWTYQINFGDVCLPIPNLYNIGPDIRILTANHVRGIFAQGNAYAPIGDFVELKAWLTAKLLWNPQADDRALIDEFLEAYYGAAAPYLRRYVALLDKDFQQNRFQYHNAYATPPKLAPWLSLDAMNEATRLFAQAEDAIAHDTVLEEHLKRVKVCIEFQWLCGFEEYKAEATRRGIPYLGPADKAFALQRFMDDCVARKVWRLCEGNGSLDILPKALLRP